MQAIKLSIRAAMDAFKEGFSLFVNHSTIFDLSRGLPLHQTLELISIILYGISLKVSLRKYTGIDYLFAKFYDFNKWPNGGLNAKTCC